MKGGERERDSFLYNISKTSPVILLFDNQNKRNKTNLKVAAQYFSLKFFAR